MNKEIFKNDCLTLPHELVVQKHLLDGASFFFETIHTVTSEFTFKRAIAESLDVHIRDIAIVGSGKLGFSIKPDEVELSYYPFRDFDDQRTSDIDIAIISSVLFDQQLVRLYEFTSQYNNNTIWKENTDRKSLAYYMLKGWLVPKYIPIEYTISDSIHEIQATYKMEFGRDINIGIYKSWYFFENYHLNNIRNIHLNLIANG